MKQKINFNELDLPIPVKSANEYFQLIETIQVSVEQDTYLLMDNLYEPCASCIDTYSLFLYLKQNNYRAKYVLYRKNPLYERLKERNELDDIIVIDESSLTGSDMYAKLFFVLIKTKYIILSFPESLYDDIRKFVYNNPRMQVVMIGHGPVFFKTCILDFSKTKYLSPERFNLYLVSSTKEKELFVNAGWPADRIFNIGLPRFDWCRREDHEKKNIVIMFTWRLISFRQSAHVEKLKYFKALKSLFKNKKLQNIAKSDRYNVIIALHHSIKDLCGIDIEVPDYFQVADTTRLIDYINTADLFITDYSSIAHDFMFLNIPVIYYRLDYGDQLLAPFDKYDLEESKKKDDQIFNVFYNERDVINKIEYYVKNDFILEDEYIEIENSFFTEKKDLCKKIVYALENYCKEDTQLPSKVETVPPQWDDVSSALCVSSSNEYAPYLCVYLKSVIQNSNRKKDIIIFERDISEENKQKIVNTLASEKTSIRFVNPARLFSGVHLHVSHDYFKEECYYRIAAPLLLSRYQKIIFTDLDLILTDDIFKLADIDMGNHPIAACVEPVWRELYMQNNRIHGVLIRDYTLNILKLSSPFMYYNTGVVVFNVKEYNRLKSFDKLLNIVGKNKLLYQEQCALNILFKDNFYTLPHVWNYELAPSLLANSYHFDFYDKYKAEEGEAKALHFLGRYKPWKNMLEYKAETWWSYARQTPFYELILQRLIDFRASQKTTSGAQPDARSQIFQLRTELSKVHFTNINNRFSKGEYQTKLLYVMEHSLHFKLLKMKYAIQKAFTFGAAHERYQKKFDAAKTLLKDARMFKKQICHV